MSVNAVVSTESFEWIDVINPSCEELDELARRCGLHPAFIQDSMEPEHLPKHECIAGRQFILLRAYDDACGPEADTVQELTRKLAIFHLEDRLITVHRKDQPYLTAVKDAWRERQPVDGAEILRDLVAGMIETYEKPVELALDRLEHLEMGVFGAQGAAPFEIQQAYYLKRRASVFRRMIRMSSEVIPKAAATISPSDPAGPIVRELRDQADHLYFYAEELTESITSLLNLHISLASQRTNEASHRINEVVRVLTIFSVFLLPLTLITGIYGMNFEHMPELRWRYGYPAALGAMVLVTVGIRAWFGRKGWLK